VFRKCCVRYFIFCSLRLPDMLTNFYLDRGILFVDEIASVLQIVHLNIGDVNVQFTSFVFQDQHWLLFCFHSTFLLVGGRVFYCGSLSGRRGSFWVLVWFRFFFLLRGFFFSRFFRWWFDCRGFSHRQHCHKLNISFLLSLSGRRIVG